MKPQVLLVFLTRFEESAAMLKGIAHFERSNHPWSAFLDDQARSETDMRWLPSKKWDGVISRHTTPALIKSCAELGIPLVDLNDTPVYAGVPKIRPNNFALGQLGAEHFLERGFRSFGYCGFSSESWAHERRDGFISTLVAARHTCESFEVEHPGDVTPEWDAREVNALSAWLGDLPKPVGIMAGLDMRALQVIRAAHVADLLVPEEVAVLGINNDTIRCELSYPPLSSIAPNAFQSGYLAAETLSRMMVGERIENMDTRVDPIGIVTRQSSDILAVSDKNVSAALSYIRENACQGINVNQVLRHTYSSRSQLEKKFRRHFGRSPQAEIRRVQVAKIRELLYETEFPLKKIADLTGFEHVEYMCVVFKRLVGDSPGSYRKRVQN